MEMSLVLDVSTGRHVWNTVLCLLSTEETQGRWSGGRLVRGLRLTLARVKGVRTQVSFQTGGQELINDTCGK